MPVRHHYLKRLWHELGGIGGEHEPFVKLIIIERIAKAAVLLLLAIGLMVAGREGLLAQWARYAQEQLNLDAGHSLIVTLLLKVLVLVGNYSHTTALALGATLYALLEGTEGVGLAAAETADPPVSSVSAVLEPLSKV